MEDSTQNAISKLCHALHYYLGICFAPLIILATLSGLAYVATPQLENYIYKDLLWVSKEDSAHELKSQIRAARDAMGFDKKIIAVRPSNSENGSTRVMFAEEGLGQYQSLAVFVNPYNLSILGQAPVYGTSGVLSVRYLMDIFHQSLTLGSWGRIYSELAAAWLGVGALSGLHLWFWSVRVRRRRLSPYFKFKSYHEKLGLSVFIGMLFFAITGLTWSRFTGPNVTSLRKMLNWQAPVASKTLTSDQVREDLPPLDELFQKIYQAAKKYGIDSPYLEIIPAKDSDEAWVVREIDRSWPTQVDQVTISPYNLNMVDRALFADFPFVAKLARWTIDFHMGVLFGVTNQVILIIFCILLIATMFYGFRIWWIKRRSPRSRPSLINSILGFSGMSRFIAITLLLVVGYLTPAWGISILAIILFEIGFGHLNLAK